MFQDNNQTPFLENNQTNYYENNNLLQNQLRDDNINKGYDIYDHNSLRESVWDSIVNILINKMHFFCLEKRFKKNLS